jgi:hypothetical protein
MRAAFLAFVFGFCTVNVWAQSASDPRVVAFVSPQISYGSYPWGRYQFQVGNVEPLINKISEPGWYDSKIGQHTVAKVSDPANGSKKAIKHKLVKGMTYRTVASPYTARASILGGWNSSSVFYDGTPYWAAFALYVDKDHPFNGSGGDMAVLSLGHPVTSKNQQSQNVLFLNRNGTVRFLISSNSVLNGTNSTYKGSSFSKPIQKGVWNYFIVQWKYHWDVSKGPYTRVWHAVGNGSPQRWVNTGIANAYRESGGFHPWKFGEYIWDVNNGWGSSSSRTIYTKGFQAFRDQPGTPTLNENSMLALMRSL